MADYKAQGEIERNDGADGKKKRKGSIRDEPKEGAPQAKKSTASASTKAKVNDEEPGENSNEPSDSAKRGKWHRDLHKFPAVVRTAWEKLCTLPGHRVY